MLHLNAITLRIAGRVLLDSASVHIPAGGRVGLVGRNGTGKSTLLKLILGEITADAGEVRLRPRMSVGRLAQEAPEGETSLIDCVLAADSERSALLAEGEHLEHTGAALTDAEATRLAEVHERLNAIAAHSAPARAAAILAGLGFPAEAHSRPVGSYSGGWRMRVALAAVLFARPDFLLLDEPTNHLDLEATLWLENHLASYPGTLIVVSHDRGLLNQVCNRILHLENLGLTLYGGNYDTFEKTRREKMELLAKAHVKQAEQRARIESFVARFRAKASKARQAQSRIKMLERMEPLVAVVEDRAMTLDFPDPDPLPPPLITVDDGVIGYGETVILRGLSLRIDQDDRIALLGANGNGKSTLAKLLTGRLELMGGEMRRSGKLRVGYFAQHQTDELVMTDTPLAHMARAMPGVPEPKVRAHLGRFGFGVAHATTAVGSLSGGEKARLLIALMCREQPHMMVLDEPTNHLDIDTREALVQALNAYGGAVVLISHDPHLVEMVADRLWLVAEGKVAAYDGDMDDYRKLLLSQAREARREESASNEVSAAARKESRRAAAEERARLAPLKKAMDAAEKQVDRLTAQKANLQARLADPALYEGPADTVQALQRDLGTLEKTLAEAEAAWMEALEAYETAQGEGEG